MSAILSQTAFTPTIARPNQVRKNFWVLGPSGQIICEFEREQDAWAFVSGNAFSLRVTAGASPV